MSAAGRHAREQNGRVIIDSAVYRRGHREDSPASGPELREVLERLGPEDFVWIGMDRPDADELDTVAGPLGLHPLAVEDALEPHQRPKVERYSDHLFVSVRAVTYSDDDIRTHEVNVFVGEQYLLSVRHGGAPLDAARRRAESSEHALALGPLVALHALLDVIVDHYEEVAVELEQDVEEVESSVFSDERTSDSNRIYRLKREVLEFRRAVTPLREPLRRFGRDVEPESARPYFRDVDDHLQRAADTIDAIDHLLDNALTAHLAQLSVQQNDDMRKLTAGATLFAVPTAIAGIYGMNFRVMPELDWTYGYPLVMGVTAVLCIGIFRRFRRAGWL